MLPTPETHLRCLCGAISAPGTILSDSAIPILAGICHCNACRHTTGSLGASYPSINPSPSQDTLSKLRAYRSSQILTRYFCSTCGCHCFAFNREHRKWYCLGGIVEPSPSFDTENNLRPKDTIKILSHDYVLDTLDGGLAPLLLNLNGRSVPAASAGPQKPDGRQLLDLPHSTILSLPKESISAFAQPEENSHLTAECHCGGVSLLVKRADYTSNSNPKLSARYIPSDYTKYLSYFCACRSCRLSTGTSLVPWALVPPQNVFKGSAATAFHANPSSSSTNTLVPVTFGHPTSSPNANLGLSLKHHWSSSDVCRSFCGRCGATVFYWCSQRPDELDLAVGILKSEEGSMARRWLEWVWGRCSFAGECIDREACEAWFGSAEVMKKIGG